MQIVIKQAWLIYGVFMLHTGFAGGQLKDYEQYLNHRHACDSPSFCQQNHYSMECSLGEKIALKVINYGAKPYTSYCPDSQACTSKSRCCEYQSGDCLIPYEDKDLFKIYGKCSQDQQCGWLYASSVLLKDQCQIRKRSNYIKADFYCISDNLFVDACTQASVTARAVQIQHSAIPPSPFQNSQCSCVITPDNCNTTASIKFRSVDIRLHDNDNITSCSGNSRLELIGQQKVKMYNCKPGEFLHGFEDFHTSNENNVVLYLHKKERVYPTKVWLEVRASLPGVNVRVTCGPRSVQTAKRCAAPPVTKSDTIDEVQTVPDRKGNKPNVVHVKPDQDGADGGDGGPSEKQNPAMAAIIGGIAAGVVVLVLMLVVVCLILRRKRNNKEKDTDVNGKPCLPYADETHHVNLYETVGDDDICGATPSCARHEYHVPWGREQGVSVQNRSKPADLAYATSEEIKVLIEKMEKDRQFLNEGDVEQYPEPDPVYYRHISDYRYKPSETDTQEGDSDMAGENANDSETESRLAASDNCGTEKLESEDSKVEADRVIDSDAEGHHVESETAGYDGYESPRVSSFQPSDASESVRDSVRSDYQFELPKINSLSRSVILEDDNHLDLDVPSEPAPPVSQAIKNQLDKSKSSASQSETSEGKVTLGSYRQPRGSIDDGIRFDSNDTEQHYSPVYDKITDKVTDEHTKL